MTTMPPTSNTVHAYRGRVLHFLHDPQYRERDAYEYWEDGLLVVMGGKVVQAGDYAALRENLPAGTQLHDYSGKLIMPGFVDTHYHMWSAIGRNFTADNGFSYFPAKNATARLFTADDFYASVMLGLVELANAGITTVHNWSHNTRTPFSVPPHKGAIWAGVTAPAQMWVKRSNSMAPFTAWAS